MSDDARKIRRIKRKVRRLNRWGKKLFYAWDAGGDQCPCYSVTEPEGGFLNEAVDKEIREAIIEKLQLPYRGSSYHKGKGEIIFTDDDALAICFSGKETKDIYDEPDSTNFPSRNLKLEDRGGLRRFIHRGEITLYVYAKLNEKPELDLFSSIQEGDAPALNEEQNAYYISKFYPILEPYTFEFGQKEKGFVGGMVELSCVITESDDVGVDISVNYEYVTDHSNETVILFQ